MCLDIIFVSHCTSWAEEQFISFQLRLLDWACITSISVALQTVSSGTKCEWEPYSLQNEVLGTCFTRLAPGNWALNLKTCSENYSSTCGFGEYTLSALFPSDHNTCTRGKTNVFALLYSIAAIESLDWLLTKRRIRLIIGSNFASNLLFVRLETKEVNIISFS